MLSQEIQAQQILIDKLKNEGQILKSSQQYLDASQTLAEIKRIEEEKEKLKKETSNMFSNISRAITKYSYGTQRPPIQGLKKWEVGHGKFSMKI